jgi:hypothetical protein
MSRTLSKTILENVSAAAADGFLNRIFHEDTTVTGNHEFLFFIKPELLLEDQGIAREAVLELIMDRIQAFGLGIKYARVIGAGYLERHGLIAQHYGVINQIASDARNRISEAGRTLFEALFELPFAQARVLGGLEWLQEYPAFNPDSLDYLWQNGSFQKLAGGTYALPLRLDGQTSYLVNGFHPRQLAHFTAQGRSIVVFTLVGDCAWSVARNQFIGKTCPADAAPGSIRRTLLEQKDAFGLKAVTPSWNGVHLSAGPIEALVELIRYHSDPEKGLFKSPGDYRMGQALLREWDESTVKALLANPILRIREKNASVFDLTEERNADDALELLREASPA